MSGADRRARIVAMLTPGLLTGGTIAERLGVSLRTIYRDAVKLKEAGLIMGDHGVGYMRKPVRKGRA